MALWARLNDGDRANSIFKGYLKEQCYASLFAKCGKPLQVDGSFGVTAGITEMLIQSHEGYIELLPALPSEWSDGEFKGVCARGGFELDFSWKNKELTSTKVLSKAGEKFRLKSNNKIKVFLDGKPVNLKKRPNNIIEFNTIEGKTYTIKKI